MVRMQSAERAFWRSVEYIEIYIHLEIPELKIPKIDPFVWNKVAVMRTRNPSAPINIVIRNSKTTIYGLDTMEITQIKYVPTVKCNDNERKFCEFRHYNHTVCVALFQRLRTRPEAHQV